MRLFFILLCFLSCYYSVQAQVDSTIVKPWTAYSQNINVSELENKEFQVSVVAKTTVKGPKSRAGLWVRVDKKDGGGFFKNNAYTIPITENWETYTIEGIVDKGAENLYFGAFCEDNGDFYFDDFKFAFKDKNGNWLPFEIANPGFETAKMSDQWIEGIHKAMKEKARNFNINYSDKEVYKGKKSLLIRGKDIIGNSPNGTYVEVNGVKLYYETYGEGEPLLMIHGNGQSLNAFMNQVEVFAKNYKVILVDSRGRGNSSYLDEVELTYALQATDMKLFIEALGIKSTHILGWSDGGIIGLLIAMNYPEKVKSLIAMGANIFPEGLLDERLESHKKKITAMEESNETGLNLDLYKLLAYHPKLEFENLEKIEAKTIIIAGDRDVIKNIHTIKIYEAIPNAQLAILPNETHYLPQENPTLFNKIVLNFLKGK